MVAYRRDEIISVTNIAKGFSNILGSITNNVREKIAISKNNKLEAVIINIDEYEKLKEAYDIMEHLELYNKIKDRENSKTILLKDSMQKQGVNIDELWNFFKRRGDNDLSNLSHNQKILVYIHILK